MKKYCDLHSHTYYSDGCHSPEYLIKECKEKKINCLSITDHDCIEVYSDKKIFDYAKKHSVELIHGVEINCLGSEILGYYFDLTYDPLLKIISDNFSGANDVNIQKIYWLKDNGFDISLEDVEKHTGPNKKIMGTHIGMELKNKGYAESLQDAFVNIIKKIKVNYHPKRITTKKTILEIINGGGVAVLPHPWLLPRNVKEDIESYLYKLQEQGLSGVETIGPHDPTEEPFIKKVKDVAKKIDLIQTGGSDFHGYSLFPENKIGEFKLDYSVLDQLKNRKSYL